jgi:hypothetical protein
MNWTLQGRRVIHKSGFFLSVDEGTIQTPLGISLGGADDLSPAELARMIRSALAHGRRLENESVADASSEEASSPRIVTRRRRSSEKLCASQS